MYPGLSLQENYQALATGKFFSLDKGLLMGVSDFDIRISDFSTPNPVWFRDAGAGFKGSITPCKFTKRLAMKEEEIKNTLTHCKTVAIVGISPKPDRPSYIVAAYLQSKGYRIIPVRPDGFRGEGLSSPHGDSKGD